jgi:hypothetical protein
MAASFEDIGKQFLEHYYMKFDSSRAVLSFLFFYPFFFCFFSMLIFCVGIGCFVFRKFYAFI